MSNQSAKKKRIGSRRRVANPSKTSEADEFQITDSTSIAQCHIPEENTESFNVLANPDSAQSETQNPPSPELVGNRRKLGSSRRNKGGQHVKDSATESYYKPREEVEGKTRGYENPETTQISLAIQPERQEELSQGSEHDIMSATHDSSLYSATTPDYSSEVQSYTTTNCPEAGLESLIPKSETDCKVASDSCKLEETMLGGIDKYDTLQSEEVKQNAHLAAISELTSLTVLSYPREDEQLIDQSDFREMPEEELLNVYSVTEKDSKERDEDTEFLMPDGNLQGNYVVSESHVESVIHFSTTPEIHTDKSSPREDTETECRVEQAEFSSSKEDSTNEEQNEIFNLSEVRGGHRSEDVVNTLRGKEVKQTEMQEIDHSSESVTHDATQNSEIITGNLMDQAEVTVKSTDDSVTNQEDSNPGDKQDEHPTKENNFEALDHKNEDDHVYDTKEPQINDIEREDTALDLVYEGEDQVEHDIKPSAEQTVHQEKEGSLSEDDKSESSLQTLQSETNAPLDSDPQQTNTGFNPIGNRRKMGSSRRNKGRPQVKESVTEAYHEHKEEVVESTRGNEPFETTQMLLAIERTSQEELSQGSEHDIIMPATHDNSLYSAFIPGYSSEVQNPSTTNYPEADLESLIPKSENIREDRDERETDFKVEVSDKSVGATLEGMDKSDTLQSQEVRGAHHSEDAVNIVHEQEVQPTQSQEIDYSSESVAPDATEDSEINSGNLMDQAEVSDTYQSDVTVESTDDSVTNQEDSNLGNKQDEGPTKENNFEALDHKNEDHHVYNTKEPWISDIEGEDTALDLVYEGEGQVEHDIKPSPEQTVHQEKEGSLSEDDKSESSLQTLQSETNAPLDSEPQQTNTGFNPIGNRRKMGSSRRNKGRQQVKESVTEAYHEHKEEVVESTRGNEPLETTQMLLAMERTSQEELSQGSEHDIIMPATHDNSLYSAFIPGYSSEVQNPTTTNYPEADLESLIPESENIREDRDERETDFKVEVSDKSVGATLEGMDKSDTLQSQEVRGAHHSEDAVNKVHEQEVQPTQSQEIDYSSESVAPDATEDSEINSGNLMDQAEVIDTYQSDVTVESTDDSVTNQEDSNLGDKQDEDPTKENNFEALDHKNEDHHVYNAKEPWINDIEREDTALDLVYEGEGQVEHDIKPSAEQTVHQEKEGSLSEDDKSKSSLQTLQSETNAPLDSDPQQTNTGFNPIGNRRKMGSSRRHKGRQQVKESVTEAYHEHKEEVVESTRGNEPLETTQMLLEIERTSQEELSQGSEHDIIMPATHDNSLYSAFIPGYSSEVQNPTTTNYPEADLESLIPKSENIREDRDERETDFKVEVSDKSVGATLEGMDKSDTLQSQEVRGAHHSEDVVNEVHEQEVQPTQTQEIDYSSESVTPDATEDSEINSGNLMDQAEVSDTYQSEVIVESTDDSVTNLEDSNPGDKQDEHPTKENNFEALDHRNEDDHVYDTKEPQINDIEREDTALDPVYEGEGQVEHDIKPSVEQTVHQEKEGSLSEDDKSESSLQTLQSETNAPLDSDPQQTNTGFNPIGNRRKMGSSRRNRGRPQVKESVTEAYHEHKEEVVESTRGNEPFETTQMLLAIERTSQEELSQGSEHGIIMPATHENSLYSAFMPGYSSEVQNPTTTNYPEVDLESLIPKSENIQEDRDERETDFRVEVSDKSVGATLEGMDKSDTLQSQEVRGAHHSEDAVNKVHEQEVQPTHTQEIDYSSESVAPDATEDSEINSGNLMDQAEVSDTYQSEVTVESTDDSVTNQEDSNPGDKQDEHPTKENSFEALDHRNEDDHVYDTKEPQINDIEREDTALDLVYEGKGQVEHDIKPSAEQTVHQEKEGILSEDDKSESSLQTLQSETNAPLDSDPQQTNTGFNAIGNRRKMGSSRRNKGRQQVKESVTEAYHEHKEEVVESTRGNEPLETTQMLLAIERMSQEELSQGSEHDIIMPATHDSSLYSAVMPGYSSEVHNTTTRNYPEADPEGLIPRNENIQEDRDERETDFKVEVSDKSVGATLEGRVERDIKPSAEQTVHQEKEGILSEDDKSESSFQTLQSETNAPLDSERQQTNTCFNPIGNRRKMGSSRRNRGRQHVKDSVAESYHRPTEEVLGNPRDNEPLETTKMSLTAETEEQEDSMETTLEGIDTFDTHQTVEVSDQVKENANVGTLVGISELNYSTLHPSPTFDQETMDQSNFREMPEEELPNVYSLTEKESKERDEHTALLRPDVNYLMSESHLKLENIESSITREISTEKNSPGEHTEIECTVEQAAFSSQKEKSSTNEEQKEHVNLSQVRGAQHSEDAVDEVHGEEVKPRHMQEMHQIDFPSITESESSLQTLQSEMNAPLDSQTLGDSQNIKQQTHTGFNPTGNRRKMGSSRRNKGRQHARDSVTESYHRSTEEVLGNTRDNESLETTKAEPEKSMETTLEGMDTYVTRHTEEVSDQVKDSAHVGTLVGISELNCSTLHPSPTVDQEMMDQSNFREMPEELPNVYSLTEKESKERDEHTELLRPDVNLHEEEVKPTHMQEMHQTNFPSITESESSLQTLQSEMNAPLDSQTPDDSQSIKQQTHTGFNPAGGRRKMGSSRRNKGRQHVSFAETYHEPKKEFEENMRGDEALETTKMLLATETLRQEELQEQTALYFKPAERIRKIRSTVYDEEDTEKMSTEDVNEVEKKLIKQPENLSQLTGDGSVKMDSTQVSVWKDSDLQNMSYHDDNVSARPGQLQVSGQDEVGEEFGDPTKKDPEAQEKNVSHVITHTELFSAADNITDTLAHIGLEENLKAESAVDVPEESGISSQQGIQEKINLDDSENLQGKSKQKRRKMGSTRRTQLNRKPEGGMDIKDETKDSDFHMEADMRNLDKMEVVEELPMIVTAEVSQNEDAKPSMSVVYREKQETNDTSAVHDKGQKLQSSTEEVVNPIKFVQVADVRDGERNVDISLEPSHLDDFTSTEMHITSVLAGRNSGSVNPLQSSNTEDASDTGITCETTQSTQNDEEKPESVNAIQDQALKSAAPVAAVADLEILKSVVRGGGGEEYKNAQARIQEPNNMNEGAHDKDLEMKSASPNLNSTSRRRKMGSTRRNLGSRTKGEDLHQKPEVDNEAAETVTHIGDVKTENFSGIKEKELQLEDKDSDSEQRKEKVFETVEYSYTGESHVKPPAHQAFEENPVLHGQQVETEHQITPAIPSTSPTHDVMSESVSGGRRRKMGSHRKSRGHQNNENQTARGDRVTDTQNGGDVRSIPDESAIKTSEKESLGLDKISEVDESDKKESSNISFSKAEEHSRPASEKTPEPVTPVQHRYAEIRLTQESQKTFSLAGNSRGADLRSNSYNVMMVGDSSVGKTSFMKRAQSGKFSLDLPASVGLDSCVWTVVLDGKPVVLQLWDTAGQERFHSITRQIFHKAQAFLLMYDITSSQSFSAVSYWASCIQEGAAENVTTVLVGNKSDHAKRQVKTQEGEILAKDYNFEFTECSAATGENVIQCLETVARMLSQKVDKREEALVLRKEPQPKKSSGCC